MHSFWADSPDQEAQAFDAFLDLLEGREDFALFHYGSYEKKLLRRMRKVVKRKDLVDRPLAKAVNVLSAIHASVYFPTFSNGLKDVGRYLGCTWTDENASGLQSLVWRARWEQTREVVWKDKLLTYNAEDCAALKKVTECVQAIGEAARVRGVEAASPRRAHQSPGPTRSPARRAAGSSAGPSSPSRTSTMSTAVPTSTTRGRRCSSAPARRSGGPARTASEEAGQASGQQGDGDQERRLPLLQGSTDHPASRENVQQARLRP